MTTYDRDPRVAEQQHRIEETRAELGATVEALAARADVRARAQQKAGEIRSRAREATPEGVRRHPMITIAGAGAAAAAGYVLANRLRSGGMPLAGRGAALQRSIARSQRSIARRQRSIARRQGGLFGAPRRRTRMISRRRTPTGILGGTRLGRRSTLSRRIPIRRGNALQRALGITPSGILGGPSYTGRIRRRSPLGGRTSMRRGIPSTRRGIPSMRRGIPSMRRGIPSIRRGIPSIRRGNALQRALGIRGGPWGGEGAPWGDRSRTFARRGF